MATSTSTAAPEAVREGRPQDCGPDRPPARKGLHRQWANAGVAALAAALAGGLALYLSTVAPLRLLELKTYDLRFVLRGPVTPPSSIILVLIDEQTEKAFPEPRIFWHPRYAALFRSAAAGGARVLGLDVFFAISVEKWAPGLDQEIAAAFSEASLSMPIVLAYDNLQAGGEELPLYMLASSQGAMGFTNLTLDPDDFARRQELQGKDAAASESFAARLAALMLGVERGVLDPSQRVIRFGSREAPLDSAGFLPIAYRGPGGTFPAVSMAQVLAAAQKSDQAQLERWFKGKAVLVGTLDPSDTHATPFYLSGSAKRGTPGVEIHANTLATILDQRFLREPPRWTAPALALGGAALAALLVFRAGFPWAPVSLAVLMAIYLAITVRALASGLVLPVTPPVLAVALGALTSYGAYSLTEGRQRRLLQHVFGQYVSSDVARELLTYGQIPLGGTRQQVTVMFSDLRNYTNYCQGRDPHQVVAELNEYFAGMSADIKAHGGMINKFIGDGIMALFGAPVPHPDDPRRAVRCALRMIASNGEFNRRRAAQGLDPLVIGIGLHTGDAVVGNIGAPEKMEYTAIGDTVNVASRIEGENKTYGCQLLVSETTYERVRDEVRAELAGNSKLKGVDEPVALYKVLEFLTPSSISNILDKGR